VDTAPPIVRVVGVALGPNAAVELAVAGRT
jgi:hypothetical protein